MSERMKKPYEGKKLKQQTSPKLTGAIFILLALLVFAIGFLVHYVQIGSLPNDAVVDLLVAQINLKFAEDFAVGFFTGCFIVIGGYYLEQKPKETEQNAQT
jgi:hypothetical protein